MVFVAVPKVVHTQTAMGNWCTRDSINNSAGVKKVQEWYPSRGAGMCNMLTGMDDPRIVNVCFTFNNTKVVVCLYGHK